MSNYKAVNNIANGFYAANKLRSMRNATETRDENHGQGLNNIALLSQILQVIAQYSPDTYRRPLDETVKKISLYGNVYRSLKSNVRETRRQGINGENILNSLATINPILGTNQRNLIDKVLRIYEILRET